MPSYFTFDYETELISPGRQFPPPVCVSYKLPGSDTVELVKPEEFYPVFKEYALNTDVIFVGHTTAFDMVETALYGDAVELMFDLHRKDRVIDISIRMKLIDIAADEYGRHGHYNLQTLAQRLIKVYLPKEDTYRLRYGELASYPISEWPTEAVEYAKNDTLYTELCCLEIDRRLAAEGATDILRDEFRQSRAALALKLMSGWGMITDAHQVGSLKHSIITRTEELKESLIDAGFIGPKSKKDPTLKRNLGVVKTHMWGVMGDRAKLTKKGLELQKAGELPDPPIKYVSLDAEACRDAAIHDKKLSIYSEYGSLSGLLTGQLKDFEKGVEAPIHAYFEVLQKTGRTGCSSPNLQNIRKMEGVRECFKPRDGWVYLNADVDRAELHTLSEVCYQLFGKSKLGESLNAGIDPHTELGARLAGLTYDEFGGRIKSRDPEAKKMRDRAKPSNFGFPGGMVATTMREYAKKNYGLDISQEEAESMHLAWKESYPVVANDYLSYIKQLIGRGETTTIVHLLSGRYRGGCTYTAAANSHFQGLAADAMKHTLFVITVKCYIPGTPLYGCRVVNQIHDEFLLEVPLSCDIAAAAAELEKTVKEEYSKWTPHFPVSCEAALCDRWSKNAYPVYADDGTLTIWRYAEWLEQKRLSA